MTSEVGSQVSLPFQVCLLEKVKNKKLQDILPDPSSLKLEARISNNASTIPSSVTHGEGYNFQLSYKLPSAGSYALEFSIGDDLIHRKPYAVVGVEKAEPAQAKAAEPAAAASSAGGIDEATRANNKRILRFTIDYPGQGRWLQVVSGQALNMDIHVRDANDQYKLPKGKLRAVAFPYTGRHGQKPKDNVQIDVPVLPDPVQPGKFQIKWTPAPGKYEFAILYNSQLIGHKKHFILKVKNKFPKRSFSLFRKKKD